MNFINYRIRNVEFFVYRFKILSESLDLESFWRNVFSSQGLNAPFSQVESGPENGVCTWTRERGELKIRKKRVKLDCRITNIVYIPSTYVYFVSCFKEGW